jgi:hypothetical protein
MIVSKQRIVDAYKAVYELHTTDSERFKDVQERTGAGMGCIQKTIGEYHEEAKEAA